MSINVLFVRQTIFSGIASFGSFYRSDGFTQEVMSATMIIQNISLILMTQNNKIKTWMTTLTTVITNLLPYPLH